MKRPLIVTAAAVIVISAVAGSTLAEGARTPTPAALARQHATEVAAAKPPWLVIPNFWPAGSGAEVVGSASGRGWIGVVAKGDGASGSTLLGSLRRVGGRLSFARSVLPSSAIPMMIVGSQLVYQAWGAAELRTAPLRGNGGIGTPRPVPDAPESIPPQQYHPGVRAAVQVGSRFVWVLTGFRVTGRTDFMWACCTGAGELSDLTRFIDHKRVMDFMQLGRDSKGRIWLAWRDTYLRSAVGSVRMVELDPDTLAPRTPKTFVVPGSHSWMRPELVCGDHCRIVVGDLSDIFTWAPGERSATRAIAGARQSEATLLDASFSSGDHLVVASSANRHFNRPPWNTEEISLVRSDARGSHARRIDAVDLPSCSGNWCFQGVYATFVPGGLAYFALYDAGGLSARSRVLAGVLPLTG